jgi:pyrroloquinoline quinone biosynthesis protein B
VAYLDGTFYDGREVPGRDLSEIPHPAMIDTMRRLKEIAAQTPGKIRFIHLNHTNPAWNDSAIRDDLERRGFQLAVPGERVGL